MTGSLNNGIEPLKNGSSTKDAVKKDGIRSLKLSEHVGFDSLPEQFVSRVIREGFVFNMMVIGATGIGKTTLVDSLFNTRFIDVSTKSHNLKTVDLHVHTHEVQEKHIKMRLSVAETRGFGDQINKTDCYKNVLKYIEEQSEKYLQEELKIHRSNNLALEDTRIHCCLYLISPFGHGLRAIDLITMKEIDKKVNLIPVIAKADTITREELTVLRKKIMSEIRGNEISIYTFPLDDPEISGVNRAMNDLQPFAVVASHDLVRVGNKKVRARQYPWGTVQVENESHSDFVRLREMLLRVNLEDLRESTHITHYEAYRRTRLEQMGFGDCEDVPLNSTFQVLLSVTLVPVPVASSFPVAFSLPLSFPFYSFSPLFLSLSLRCCVMSSKILFPWKL